MKPEISFCNELVEQGLLQLSDLIFAKNLVKGNQLSFMTLLFAFTRLGHLCMELGERIFPSLSELGGNEGQLKRLEEEVRRAEEELPPDLVEKLSLQQMRFEKPVGRWNNRYYLQRSWVLESNVVKELERLLKRDFSVVKPLYIEKVEGVNEEQEEAIKKILLQHFSLLIGGPGTGKTHAIIRLVELFLKEEEGRVLIAAPTGKAAAELKKRFETFPGKRLQIGTLHALLGIREFADLVYSLPFFSEQLIIIDECSMIDVALWGALLRAIRGGSRVVLVGDPNQLPPVETGTIYKELATFFKKQISPSLISLEQCMRIESREILALAAEVKQGKISPSFFTGKEEGNLSYYDLKGISFDLQQFSSYFPSPSAETLEPLLLFKERKRFQILSSLKNGAYGMEEINRFFWELYSSEWKEGDFWAVPIIITKTSYSLNLTNGETGFLLKKSPFLSLEAREEAIFLDGEKEGKVRTLLAALLPSFSLAYALSVHKSQGSEYERVALFLPEGSEVFGREILYTGITRARKKLEIIGEKGVIEKCLQKTSEKFSGIGERLRSGK